MTRLIYVAHMVLQTLTANDPKFSESFLTTGTMDVASKSGVYYLAS